MCIATIDPQVAMCRSSVKPVIIPCLFVATLFVAADARADRLELTSGGRVDGEIVNRERTEDEPYIVRTEFGKVYIASRDVAGVQMSRDEQRQYKRIVKRMPPTAEGNWKMAQWCLGENLLAERRRHLEEVLRLEPNHEQARKALDFIQRDGEWVTRKEMMNQRGFERHGGQWRLPQDIAIIEAREKQEEVARNYRNQIKRWRGWIGKRREAEAIEGLNQLNDPLAVAAITEQLERETDNRVLRLYIAALARIGTTAAVQPLVGITLKTDDEELRVLCLDCVRKSGQTEYATGVLTAALTSNTNVVIHRAARGLAQLEDPSAIRPLIEALVTTHKAVIGAGQEGRIAPTFSSGPTGSSGGLSMGAPPSVKNVAVKNRPVLDALLALCDVNYDFDQSRWRQWYESEHTPKDVDLRRDR